MPIILNEDNKAARVVKWGAGTANISATQWLNIRHGTPEAPIDMLLEQVPEGKQWTVSVTVYIEETDA